MSRMAIAEYIGAKRRAYLVASRKKRHQILQEVCETVGYEKKYANKLLLGHRKFKERKGRGKTYGEEVAKVLQAIWEEVGCPCTTYFKANCAEWIREYTETVATVSPAITDALLRMSASTMDRMLKGVDRRKLGSQRHNRRSGYNWQLLQAIECKSGEEITACKVKPGDIQADTVALCGGDMAWNFWWILTVTDRKTQWTEIEPTWNHGMHTTLDALKTATGRIPFPILSLHHDNGKEFVNLLVAEYFGVRKRIPLSRSRFRKKNDNAHVEQKNGSVVRELFGEGRLDNLDLGADLVRLCHEYADFRNFCVPCKMLVSKIKKPSGKGFATKYDAPKTPYMRVLEDPDVDEAVKAKLRLRKAEINGIDLFHRLRKRLRRIRAKQESSRAMRNTPEEIHLSALREDSALRAAPAGTSSATGVEVGGLDLRSRPISHRKRMSKGVQYLTNAKARRQSLGVLTT